MTAAGGLSGILLERKQLKIEGPLSEPDERNADYRQRFAGKHQSGVGPGVADQISHRQERGDDGELADFNPDVEDDQS